MLRKSLTILAILALVAVVPAVAFAGNGNGVDRQPIRAQLQVDPGTCDGTCPGFGYGLEDGSELPPAPGDGTGFGAMNRGRGARGVGPMDGTGPYHVDGAAIAPRDGTGLRMNQGRRGGNAGAGLGTCPNA